MRCRCARREARVGTVPQACRGPQGRPPREGGRGSPGPQRGSARHAGGASIMYVGRRGGGGSCSCRGGGGVEAGGSAGRWSAACARFGHMSGWGEGEGPGAGGLWRVSAAVLCKAAQGLGVTSLPAGGAGRGERGGSSVQCGGGARGLVMGEGEPTLPLPRLRAARRTWGRTAASPGSLP